MPDSVAAPLTTEFNEKFAMPIINGIKHANKLPTLVINLKPRTYPRLLERLNEAGMLYWRLKHKRTTPLQKFADHMQLTLFAVSKNPETDQLICWPRVGNEFCPSPPKPDFPDPSLFRNQIFRKISFCHLHGHR